jgi:hypothetical protein
MNVYSFSSIIQAKEDQKTEISIRTAMQIKLNEAEATILINQKLIRELKTDLRQKEKKHLSALETERADRHRISIRSNSETRELKNAADIFRQELHNERTSWALERARLERFNLQNETTIASLTMELQNVQNEVEKNFNQHEMMEFLIIEYCVCLYR